LRIRPGAKEPHSCTSFRRSWEQCSLTRQT
jgi:hypothetical protein